MFLKPESLELDIDTKGCLCSGGGQGVTCSPPAAPRLCNSSQGRGLAGNGERGLWGWGPGGGMLSWVGVALLLSTPEQIFSTFATETSDSGFSGENMP